MSWKPGQRAAYAAELDAAAAATRGDDATTAFSHLERAHILGQRDVYSHVRAHWRMLMHGWRQRDGREVIGQLPRIVAALTKTLIWVPAGNTGGARVSAFRPMPIPTDLRRYVDEDP